MPRGVTQKTCTSSECSNFMKPQTVNTGARKCGCGMPFTKGGN